MSDAHPVPTPPEPHDEIAGEETFSPDEPAVTGPTRLSPDDVSVAGAAPEPAEGSVAPDAATPTEVTPAAPQPPRRYTRRSPLAPLSSEEQARLRRFLLRWTRPGCGVALTFGLTLSLWAWALVHPHPALWFFGALLSPWTTPVVGVALGLALGQRAVLRRGLGLTVALGLTSLAVGYGAGWLTRAAARPSAEGLAAVALPDMPSFVLTLVAAVWSTVLLARRRAAALLPGAALTWGVALPLFWAGAYAAWGELQHASWALLAFGARIFWSWLLAAVVLILLGLYPSSWLAYGLLTAFFVAGVGTFLLYAEADLQRRVALAPTPAVSALTAPQPTPVPPTVAFPPTPSPTPSPTPTPPRPSPTPSPMAAVATYTVVWPTATPSPTPTPIYAVVRSSQRYTGIYVREGPGFDYPAFTGLLNGTLITILPGEPVEADGVLWVRVRFEEFGREKEGWVLYNLLLLVTPTPTPLD